MREIGQSSVELDRTNRPVLGPREGSGPGSLSSFVTGWRHQEAVKKGVVETGLLLTTPLGDTSSRRLLCEFWPPHEGRPLKRTQMFVLLGRLGGDATRGHATHCAGHLLPSSRQRCRALAARRKSALPRDRTTKYRRGPGQFILVICSKLRELVEVLGRRHGC